MPRQRKAAGQTADAYRSRFATRADEINFPMKSGQSIEEWRKRRSAWHKSNRSPATAAAPPRAQAAQAAQAADSPVTDEELTD
jgi:hypothetical protein